MLIRSSPDVASTVLPSEITPETVYQNRRALLQKAWAWVCLAVSGHRGLKPVLPQPWHLANCLPWPVNAQR
jgi:hypothetical protein